MKRSEAFFAIALMLPVSWLFMGLREWWFLTLVGERRFGPSPVWWSPAHVNSWGFEFGVSLLLGVLLACVLRSRSCVAIAALCGGVLGLVHFVTSSTIVFPEAHWSTYVWAYGLFVVPIVGAVLGAVVIAAVRRRSAVRVA